MAWYRWIFWECFLNLWSYTCVGGKTCANVLIFFKCAWIILQNVSIYFIFQFIWARKLTFQLQKSKKLSCPPQKIIWHLRVRTDEQASERTRERNNKETNTQINKTSKQISVRNIFPKTYIIIISREWEMMGWSMKAFWDSNYKVGMTKAEFRKFITYFYHISWMRNVGCVNQGFLKLKPYFVYIRNRL